MKITEEIKEKPVDEYREEKQNDIFYTLLSGKTVTEKIETSRGDFIVKFPKQKDVIAIDRRIAFLRGGVPAESFDAVGNFNMQKVATLDICIESGPKWFENLKEKNNNFSWGDMPDVNFVNEVYSKAYGFRLDVQKQFGSDEEKGAGAVPDGKDIPADVGDNVFSGVAATAKRL